MRVAVQRQRRNPLEQVDEMEQALNAHSELLKRREPAQSAKGQLSPKIVAGQVQRRQEACVAH